MKLSLLWKISSIGAIVATTTVVAVTSLTNTKKPGPGRWIRVTMLDKEYQQHTLRLWINDDTKNISEAEIMGDNEQWRKISDKGEATLAAMGSSFVNDWNHNNDISRISQLNYDGEHDLHDEHHLEKIHSGQYTSPLMSFFIKIFERKFGNGERHP